MSTKIYTYHFVNTFTPYGNMNIYYELLQHMKNLETIIISNLNDQMGIQVNESNT